MTHIESHIVPARPEHVPQLVELAQLGFPGYPFLGVYDESQLTREITSGDLRWVTLVNEQVVATAVLGIEGGMAEIKRVVVDPKLRQNGIGTKLTSHLHNEALLRNLQPYADVRGDQPGMQGSALKGGLSAWGLEVGKHVVYEHPNPLGAARETMIHMSTVALDLSAVRRQLEALDRIQPSVRHVLLESLSQSNIAPKRPEVAKALLPSAREVKTNMHHYLIELGLIDSLVANDIEVVIVNGWELIIVLPDKSAFIIGNPNHDLKVEPLIDFAQRVGLQMLTAYVPIDRTDIISALYTDGFQPALVRPWTENIGSNPIAQLCMRIGFNRFEECLHPINLRSEVQSQIIAMVNALQ